MEHLLHPWLGFTILSTSSTHKFLFLIFFGYQNDQTIQININDSCRHFIFDFAFHSLCQLFVIANTTSGGRV